VVEYLVLWEFGRQTKKERQRWLNEHKSGLFIDKVTSLFLLEIFGGPLPLSTENSRWWGDEWALNLHMGGTKVACLGVDRYLGRNLGGI